MQREEGEWERDSRGKEEKSTRYRRGRTPAPRGAPPLEGVSTSPLFMVAETSLFIVVVTSTHP
jgi:hypothetical protein